MLSNCVLPLFGMNDVAGQGKRFMADTCPDASGPYALCYTIRQKWAVVYQKHYIPMCEKRELPKVPYNRFCEIRSTHRPNYMRHRKVIVRLLIYQRNFTALVEELQYFPIYLY